ncbi:hypothetical protein H6P81_017983 [Aristolochia fimbriata]|uniref:Late embryogenesis abundant protein LEA-2 subgroup domain-containing protein n=1 Tax=Aristolochia fimbriata TaxID=158543 RepID=A0AAV7E043_ARIFI|nr:hypothetical protein H6P81_017983 [Aristolochia fimbriata]
MHRKTDSEGATSLDASTPPRSPRRPLYYVQSPSQHDAEKMSVQSSPLGSPHFYYHCSPIHHSRESSTTRFSASMKQLRSVGAGVGAAGPWKKIHAEPLDEDEDGEGVEDKRLGPRFYVFCFVFSFLLLFSLFSLILWGASRPYKPRIAVKSLVIDGFNIQAGSDATGVPTKMMTIKSTVTMFYRNPATFFGVHVSATPFTLHFYDLKIASGRMKEFYESRKSRRKVRTSVEGKLVPLYGVGASIGGSADATMNLTLSFTLRSRAFVLGKLVKAKFYRTVACDVVLKPNHPSIGRRIDLRRSCSYD